MQMCDPATIATIQAVATVGTAVSQYQAAGAQADVANQNAKLAESKVADVEYQKQQQIKQINEQKRQTQGAQRAAMAASGVDSSYGSGLSILTDAAFLAQEDENETEFNATKQGWGYKVKAANYRNQAKSAKKAGQAALAGGILGATGQYFSGLESVNPKWKKKP
jgi:hypothetical protein